MGDKMSEENTREQLLSAAKAEFLRCGYQKASLRKICATADVTTGALYFFFKNKEQLFTKLAGWFTYKMFCKIKNEGKFPALIMVTIKLCGLKKEDLSMTDNQYMKASDESVKRNFMENYTYRTRPEIAQNETMVYLWCGSKEPYALKSHKELKKYLKNYEETVMEGLGHGDFLMKHTAECCEKIRETLG